MVEKAEKSCRKVLTGERSSESMGVGEVEMKVFNEWKKKEFIDRHLPKEFRQVAEVLTCEQIENLSTSIDEYYGRIRRSVEEKYEPRKVVDSNRK